MDYEKLKVKEYNLWDLFLHEQQHPYIGRCYVWARRGEAKKVTDMTLAEGAELFQTIIPSWDNAIKNLFNHDWPNVAIFGNEAPLHLHAHLIPRYNTS